VDDLLSDLVSRLRGSLAARGAEVAHLKVIALTGGGFAVANLVSSRDAAELSVPSGRQADEEFELIVNARVALDPDVLRAEVESALADACQGRKAAHEVRQMRCLRPGRPVPTHRYATAVS
jgi:hypothetical protein